MALDTTVRARVDSRLKEETEKIFEELGLTTSQAIVLFLKSVKRERGIPFSLKIPREYEMASELSQSLHEVQEGKTRDIQELLDAL